MLFLVEKCYFFGKKDEFADKTLGISKRISELFIPVPIPNFLGFRFFEGCESCEFRLFCENPFFYKSMIGNFGKFGWNSLIKFIRRFQILEMEIMIFLSSFLFLSFNTSKFVLIYVINDIYLCLPKGLFCRNTICYTL